MNKMDMESKNIVFDNVKKIGELFPNCITETIDENGKLKKTIDFDMLKLQLTNDVVFAGGVLRSTSLLGLVKGHLL